jgi:hypothetical protein
MAERLHRSPAHPWARLGARLAPWLARSEHAARPNHRLALVAPAAPPTAVLADASGARVTLTLRGYQFARATTVDDANTLLIGLSADDGQDRWTATQPALLTWEVVQLIGWLRAVADGASHAATIDFTEPDLALAADGVGDAARLSVRLAAGFRPAWVPAFGAAAVSVRPGVVGLRRCADALAAALADYPIRDGRSG